MNIDQIQRILADHAKWLRGDGGARADLRGADLTRAVLTCADLTRADLTRVVLTGADLRDAVLTDADLTGADLTDADLRDAVLTCADLTRADLRGADLRGAVLTDGKFLARAAVQFSAHSECGRELSAIKTDAKENNVTLYCGCFVGTPEQLREYIAKCEAKHIKSRTLAMDTVLMLLEQERV